MPIYEDEAVVLRHYPIAESDCVVVCIAPELGKIRAVAQGIKKPKNRFAGSLELLNHVRVTIFSREGQELGKIRRAELIHSFSGRIASLKHIFAFSYFAELVYVIAQYNQANSRLFRLLLASLKAGEKLVSVEPLVRYFEIWSLKISGLYPNYAYCSNCGKYVKENGFFALIKDGCGLCRNCSAGKGVFIGSAASSALRAIEINPPEVFSKRPLEEEAGRQIEQLTKELLGANFDSPFRSYRILKEAPE